jgi:hypothetical protein
LSALETAAPARPVHKLALELPWQLRIRTFS